MPGYKKSHVTLNTGVFDRHYNTFCDDLETEMVHIFNRGISSDRVCNTHDGTSVIMASTNDFPLGRAVQRYIIPSMSGREIMKELQIFHGDDFYAQMTEARYDKFFIYMSYPYDNCCTWQIETLPQGYAPQPDDKIVLNKHYVNDVGNVYDVYGRKVTILGNEWVIRMEAIHIPRSNFDFFKILNKFGDEELADMHVVLSVEPCGFEGNKPVWAVKRVIKKINADTDNYTWNRSWLHESG